MNYEGKIYRPPSEHDAWILQATIGCSWNHCTYCDMYRGVSFSAKPWGTVLADIREALAAELFETGAAGRMVAAIAEQTAELYGHVALNPSFSEVVAGHGERFKTWKHIEILLSRLDPENAETHLVANLLANHFVQGNLSQPTDIDPVLARWRDARQLLGGHTS